MKLTANIIIELYTCFNELLNKEVDFNSACNIATNLKNLSVPKEITEKRINNLIEEYADRDEKGNIIQLENNAIKLKEDNGAECNMKIAELLNSETDIDLKPIEKKSLSEIKTSPRLLLNLMECGLLIEE